MTNIKRRTDEARASVANMAFTVQGLLFTLALAFVAFNKECCASYNVPPPCPEPYKQLPVQIEVCFMFRLFLILISYPPIYSNLNVRYHASLRLYTCADKGNIEKNALVYVLKKKKKLIQLYIIHCINNKYYY